MDAKTAFICNILLSILDPSHRKTKQLCLCLHNVDMIIIILHHFWLITITAFPHKDPRIDFHV